MGIFQPLMDKSATVVLIEHRQRAEQIVRVILRYGLADASSPEHWQQTISTMATPAASKPARRRCVAGLPSRLTQ